MSSLALANEVALLRRRVKELEACGQRLFAAVDACAKEPGLAAPQVLFEHARDRMRDVLAGADTPVQRAEFEEAAKEMRGWASWARAGGGRCRMEADDADRIAGLLESAAERAG